ncbi:MAG: hypothetical protein HQK87_02925 [Nitrospinae bacterium]|nr:hypothetical protein [Nitrospinota bacterium]
MRIDGLDPLKGTPAADPAKRSQPAGGPSFADLLSGAMGGGAAGSAGAVGGAGPVSSVPFIIPPVSASGPSLNQQASGLLESFFSDMDMLQNGLSNEELPMDQLQGIIDTLTSRKDELAAMIGKMPEGEMKNILTEGLTLGLDQLTQYYANKG